MCGIIGYIGMHSATPLLLEGLKRMEYRGYDSAGVAVMNGAGVETRKAAGEISQLERALATSPGESGMGVGHTPRAPPGGSQEGHAPPPPGRKSRVAARYQGNNRNIRSA